MGGKRVTTGGGSIVAVVAGKQPRLFSSSRDRFPVADPTTAYFCVDESGVFEWINDHKKLPEHCDKAARLEQTLFAVWPGATRSDVFVIDDPIDFKNRYILSAGPARTVKPRVAKKGAPGRPAPKPAFRGPDADDGFFWEDDMGDFVDAVTRTTVMAKLPGGILPMPVELDTRALGSPETEEDWEGEPPFKMITRDTDTDDDMFFDVSD
jgi:hypothetical protein